MILRTPTRQSARLIPSYNFEILPDSDQSDHFFKSLLIEDFKRSDDQDINRFKVYLEKVINFAIFKRPLLDFVKILEDTLQEYDLHLKTNVFPKTS